MSLRFNVINEAIKRKAVAVVAPEGHPADYFGENVFNNEKMLKYLPKKSYDALLDTMQHGTFLDNETANYVAEGMKKWALEKGVTHYTHWFQPLTGGTAEKHDSFIDPDGKGGVIEEFSGKLLIQQEPDASSFPSGGIRNTFEARGYSAWDPTSPAFIMDDTLCIPTIFISYTGEVLDYKAPLLKSLAAVNKAATDVCHYFDADADVTKVYSYLGWEQEYFLVDEALWAVRPDLVLTGRTLLGHESAKNQQLEDHYFGSIPTRVAAFMKDLEFECLKLGIPAKTRHNEVAPNQFELAPVYEETNLANDHNILLMSVMKKVARRHCFRALLHEKPFKGINGSGKHNNWSLGTDTGANLLSPGKTTEEKLRFITFIANVMMAVWKHNGLMKASISSATNAHRLGANEAPPAIISIFLGTQITAVLNDIEKGENFINMGAKQSLKFDISHIPGLLIDNTDRNRTSPFAFTGNRFEFRAVGSSANCASAMIVLNTAVAEQLSLFKTQVDAKIAGGATKENAIMEIVREYIIESKAIRFDGNNYSDEWKAEAKKRGLDCETSVPLIFDRLLTDDTVDMYTSTGVLSEKELEARAEVELETYTKKIQIEARVLGDIASNHIIPVASRYQEILLSKIDKVSRLFPDKLDRIAKADIETVENISDHVNLVRELTVKMVNARKVANRIVDGREKAIAYHDTVAVLLDEIRYHIDKLELSIDNEMWPLPKYRELLFIR